MFLPDERIFGCFGKLSVMGCLVPAGSHPNPWAASFVIVLAAFVPQPAEVGRLVELPQPNTGSRFASSGPLHHSHLGTPARPRGGTAYFADTGRQAAAPRPVWGKVKGQG
jgi:hypothetical protein